MKRRSRSYIVLAAVLAIAAGAAVWAAFPTSGSRVPQAWPAFDMTYRVSSGMDTGTGQRWYQVWELRYDSDSSWSQQLIEDTEYPARAGSTESFDGRTHRQFNALANTTHEDSSTEGTLTAPGEWFVPRPANTFAEKGYTEASSVGGGREYARSARIPCPSELDGNNGRVQCDPDGTVEVTTRVSVEVHGIPELVESTVGTTSTNVLEVLSFAVRAE